MEYRLNTLQKLDLYQVIAFAKEGDTARVIERAHMMLKSSGESLVTLTDEELGRLARLSLGDILNIALAAAPAAQPDAA